MDKIVIPVLDNELEPVDDTYMDNKPDNLDILKLSATQKELADRALELSLKIYGNSDKHANSDVQNEAARVIGECSPEVIKEIKKLLAPSMSYDGDMVNNMLLLKYSTLNNREKRASAMRQFMQTAHASFVMSPPERMYLNQLVANGRSDDRSKYFYREIAIYDLHIMKKKNIIKPEQLAWMIAEIKSGKENMSKTKEERSILYKVTRTAEVKVKMIEKLQRGIISSSSLTRTVFTRHSHLKYHGKDFRFFANTIADMVESSGRKLKSEVADKKGKT